MKFNKNNYILILLYLIIVVFLLLQIYELYETKIENFADSNIIKNNNIHSITLDPNFSNDNEYDKYYGTFIKSSSNNTIQNALSLLEIDETVSGNKWAKIEGSEISATNKIIINDITYDKYKHMMCIGLYYKNNKPIYNIYRKKTIDINSDWELKAYNTKLRSLCYDIKTGKLLGISSYNGQIYEQNVWDNFGHIPTPTTAALTTAASTTAALTTAALTTAASTTAALTTAALTTAASTTAASTTAASTTAASTTAEDVEGFYGGTPNIEHGVSSSSSENNRIDGWTGPINNDIPMKKIMYSSDEVMIGIGLFDNYIYKKEGENWKTSYWDKNQINKTKVYDLIYDKTGCLIATSPDGILIQEKVGFMMPFTNYKGYNRHDSNKKKIFEKSQILKYKIGYDIFNDTNLKQSDHPNADPSLLEYLQKIYKIKKLSLDLCSSRKYIRNKDKKINEHNSLSTKYREIDDLYKKIENINDNLSK